MSEGSRSQETHDPRLNRILAEYLEAAENGQAVAVDVWIRRYPEFADELRAFVAGHDRLAGMVSPAETLPPDTSALRAPQEAFPSPATVRYFGEYELLEEIARGGMGVVYKARQTTLKRIVALKMILAGQLAGAEDVKRFYAEAEAAAKLQHPNIVPIFEIGQHEGQHYFSMAFVEGESLARKIVSGPLPPKRAAALMKTVAEAVAFAHIEGVVHRDLKPANVLLDQRGEPHITDFGLAKRMSTDATALDQATGGLTATGQILGTPSYMPPEQAAGKSDEIGPLSDVYSLGAMLYCLLTGRPPFQAATPLDTLLQVMQKEPLAVRQLAPEVPRDLETICMKCLEKEPRRRYASARELADDLQRFTSGEAVKARPISRPARAWRWCRRKPLVAGLSGTAAGLLLLVAVVASLGYFATRSALDQSRRNLYVAHVHLARQAIEDEQDGQALKLLRQYTPQPGRDDVRGWEWDYLRSKSRILLSLEGKHGQRNAAWSPDGKRLAYYDDGLIRIIDGAGRQAGPTLTGHNSRWLAWSPDGAQLASAGYQHGQIDWPGEHKDAQINVWDASRGQLLHQYQLSGKKFIAYSQHIAWSPDGKRLAWGGRDPNLRIFDLATEKQILSMPANPGGDQVTCLAWSPDGTRLATSRFVQGDVVRIWDATSGELIHTLPRSDVVAWSPDGKQLAAAGKVWDTTTWEELLTLRVSAWNSVAWSGDGRRIAASFALTKIFIWDAATGDEQLTLLGDGATALEWNADNLRLLALTNSGQLIVWNTAERPQDIIIPAHTSTAFSVSWGPDGRQVASAGYDETIKVWDGATGKHVRTLEFDGPVYQAAWSPNGRWMAFIDKDFKVRVVDATSGVQLKSLKAAHDHPQAIDWSADGRWLAAGGRVWDTTSWNEVYTLHEPGAGDFLAWSPDSSQLAISGVNRLLKFWRAGTDWWDTRTTDLQAHGPLSWSPNGDRVATGGQVDRHAINVWKTPKPGAITLWDAERLADPPRLALLQGHSQHVTSLAWHPRGDRLVSASLDGTVRVWDPQSGQEVISFRGRSSAGYRDAQFSPDGRRLAAAGQDGSLAIWDAAPLLRTSSGP